MRGQETCWVGSSVLIRFSPLEALWCDPVRGEGTTSRSERASDHHCLVRKPRFVVCQDPRMERDILRTEMWLLVGLSMNPSQRLQVPQVFVIRKLCWQGYIGVRANLWNQDHAAYLFHLWIIWWRDAVEVGSNLGSKVTDANERLEDILWHDIRVACLANIFTVDIQVIGTEVERSSTDRPNTPLSPRGEGLLLIRRASCHNHLFTMDV